MHNFITLTINTGTVTTRNLFYLSDLLLILMITHLVVCHVCRCGVSGIVVQLIISYLSGRHHGVKLEIGFVIIHVILLCVQY